jgi:hypothetical protein
MLLLDGGEEGVFVPVLSVPLDRGTLFLSVAVAFHSKEE